MARRAVMAILGLLAMRGWALGPRRATSTPGWMEGRWVARRGGPWRILDDPRGARCPIHRDVKGPQLLSWEFLRIDTTARGLLFRQPRSAPPTAFKLVEAGERRVVFENRQHDFPQRILYWLDARGALHARIEGPQGGQTVAEEWVWTKAR